MMRAVILCRVLFGYGPLGIKKLTVLEAGDGGIAEMTQHLSPDAVMFFRRMARVHHDGIEAPTHSLLGRSHLHCFLGSAHLHGHPPLYRHPDPHPDAPRPLRRLPRAPRPAALAVPTGALRGLRRVGVGHLPT